MTDEMVAEGGQVNEGSVPTTFSKKVLGIAGTVQDRTRGGGSSRGERAELRRMHPGDPFPPEPFWRLVERYGIRPADEEYWREVVPLMVLHPHNDSLSPGRAIAASGVSGQRVERWLRLEARRARIEARKLMARLGDGLNWLQFARLLREWSEEERLRFARDFFLSPEFRSRNQRGGHEEEKK